MGSELAMTCLFRTTDLRVGATGRFVQVDFQLCAQFFHGLAIGVRRHKNRSNAHQCASSEWQIDGGAIPIVKADETAGRHCEGHDRPSGFPCQHDYAEASDARALWHVGSQRNIIAVCKRSHHLLERTDAALALKRRPMIAGAAYGADAKPFGGDRVEFAVAMPRDQHLAAMVFLGLYERRHEMLAVPKREDRRLLRLDDFIDVWRIEAEFVGQPDQPQELGREKPHSALDPAAAQHIAN